METRKRKQNGPAEEEKSVYEGPAKGKSKDGRKGQRHDEEIVEIAPISNVDIIAAMKLSLEKKQKELEEEKEIKNLREQLASVEEEKATGSNCFCYDYDDYYDNYDCYHDVLQFSRRNPNRRSLPNALICFKSKKLLI